MTGSDAIEFNRLKDRQQRLQAAVVEAPAVAEAPVVQPLKKGRAA